MMNSELISEALILLDFSAASKEEVISKLAGLLANDNRLSDPEAYVQKVFDREAAFSTAIGHCVAIPHGKSQSVKASSVAFGRLREAISWGDEKVRLVFLLAVPEAEAGREHLRLLAELAKRLMSETFRDALMQLETEKEIIGLLNISLSVTE
jgi:fructose PTS system EIIA component